MMKTDGWFMPTASRKHLKRVQFSSARFSSVTNSCRMSNDIFPFMYRKCVAAFNCWWVDA